MTAQPAPETSALDERYLVPGLIRGLQVLQTFSKDRREQNVAEMAAALGVTRSTAFRLVYTLEAEGYLRKSENGKRYQLGSKVMDLGFAYLAGQDLADVAAPYLSALRDETQTSTHLTVREGREVVYIARYVGKTSLVSAITIGSRLPAHATAPGRVLLSGLTMTEIASLYDGAEFQRYTPSTPTSLSALISQVEEDRKRTSLVSYGYYDAEIAGVAAPVFDREGKVTAAITVSCPINTYELSELEGRIARRVEASALDLSHALGYRG